MKGKLANSEDSKENIDDPKDLPLIIILYESKVSTGETTTRINNNRAVVRPKEHNRVI
tara:strand:- start:5200 stop:5373 length:174 start_codon:yes stop_codon:yes gene_type:complete